jgi:hypothetical protein
VDDMTRARCALMFVPDPAGIAALETVLNRFEQDLQAERAAFQRFREGAGGAVEARDAMVDLRTDLEHLRDIFRQRARDVDRLYWDRLVPRTPVEAVIDVIRAHSEAIDDLLFHLPFRRPPAAPSPAGGLPPEMPCAAHVPVRRLDHDASAATADLRSEGESESRL